MTETLSVLPASFWVVVALSIGGAVWAVRHFRDGSGLPILLVLGTVAAWYVGDALYNDYANYHVELFDPDVLRSAWWQVAWFLTVFLLATPWIHRWLNARDLHGGSGVLQLFKTGVRQPAFQGQLTRLFYGCAVVWLILAVIAVIQLRGQAIYFFCPLLGYKASPWGHARLGAGFDFLSIIAVYLQLLVAGIFGVITALSCNRRVFWLALVCCLVTWPYFIFDRTRNTILAVVIPGMLSWIFLRMRGGMLKRLVALTGCFLLINSWMGFVIANRSSMSIIDALKERGFSWDADEEVHHQGLNMYEELCWINTFIEDGSYKPNWGSRYFAELVNPIPRALWPGKPLIGIDYAIARGQASGQAEQAGVYATISTGMIGQGVVNFGRVLGPAFAALLMSLWVAILARLDLHIREFGRLPLYALGVILTFNLGRDITLITLYPFAFGALAIWYWDRFRTRRLERGRASIPAGAASNRGKARVLRRSQFRSRQPTRLGSARRTPASPMRPR